MQRRYAPFQIGGLGALVEAMVRSIGWCLCLTHPSSTGVAVTLSGAPRSVSTVRAGADLALAAGAWQQVTLVFQGRALSFLNRPSA